MLNKSGQVTIFIIIAIILVAVVVLFFAFKGNLGILGLNPEISNIKGFVESCIEETGKEAILFVSSNGGYFLTPEFSTSDGIPYYYFNGRSYIPSKERIENEISLYMNSLLSFCTNEFVDFPTFNITEGDVNTRTSIREEKITFDVEYPIAVRKGDESSTIIKDFKNIRVYANMDLVYNAINEIIENQMIEGGNFLCISCITEIASENDLEIEMVPLEDGVIFNVRDNNLKIKDVALEWRFANRYE